MGVGLSPGFWQHLYNSTQDVLGGVTLSQTAGGKNPANMDPTTTQTQLQRVSLHKWHKGHPKSIRLRWSRTLHDGLPQVPYLSQADKDKENQI